MRHFRRLSEVQFPDNITKIAGGFRDSNLSYVVIPEGVEEIGRMAFANCRTLEYVHLPSSLRIIENGAFAGSGLFYLHIPEGVVEIRGAAFFNSSLGIISIPSTIKIIHDPFVAVELLEVHSFITDLNNVRCGGDFFDCEYLYVPTGMLEAYKQHPYFGKAKNIIER